jgi:hypothetical protein
MTAVSDSFNRADSTNLGASWTEIVGDWAIVSNKVQCNDDAGSTGYYARYDTDVGSSDMFAQAVTSATQANGSSSSGLAVRQRAGANTSYQLTTRHAGDTIGNWRIVAGSETQLNFQTGANNISTTINSGDTIRLEVVGSLLRSKVQGALVGLTVDTTTTDGQRAGLNGYNAVGTDVVELDDFAGGALAADGGLVAPYIVGVSAQVTGVGTTLTPTVPPVVATGDIVIAQCTSRDAAQTMTNPASEGWAAGPTPSQTGLEDAVFYKVWGLGGQTDDTTPTFSIGAGTAGWGVTLTVIRNPAHATAPWTSTASAVVATGSATNAASATVTAPSVNHDGTNRTVVRLFSSADDNALNAPSTGALAYGAAAYDSTDGNDFAQAMSLREDITVTTNTGTSTVTETAVGNDINNGITLVLAIPSAGTNAAAGAGTGAGTASQAAISASTTGGPGSGAATAPAATPKVGPNPGVATATGAANPATILTGSAPTPPAAAGSGSANTPTAAVAVSAGLASATGAAGAGTLAVAASAGAAAAAGSAPQATAQTGSFVNSSAGTASGAGQAFAVSGLVAPSGGTASGAGSAGPAGAHLAVSAGVATGTGAAFGAVGAARKLVFAGLAEGLAEAHPARALVAVGAGAAAGQGTALPADVDAGVPFVDPNPTVVRVRESNPTISDSRVQRLRES